MADRDEREASSPIDQVRAVYEQAESQTARAFESAVSKPSFGLLLARSAENVAALARIGEDTADLVLRSLRVAGRADIIRLARQLHRTEDKLERVLQELEDLRDEVSRRERAARLADTSGAGDPELEPEPDDAAEPDTTTPKATATTNGHDREGPRKAPAAR